MEIARLALEKKALDVVVLNVAKLSSVSDYIVICGAESDKQAQAIAYNIEDGLEKKGVKPIGMEGVSSGRWALVDYGDVVAHVFLDEVRRFYDIEGLWADAPRTDVKDIPAKKKKSVVKTAEKAAKPSAVKKAAPKKASSKPAAGKTLARKKASPKPVVPRTRARKTKAE